MRTRTLKHMIPAVPVIDGGGVKLRRSIGQSPSLRLDPFLMLDEFSSSSAEDYIAGFPDHPHRGFETVTYMLDGHMLHQDHLGNHGHLKSGGAQWMTAGRGIIHSEMPQQESGRMRGFQLWINLPASKKMQPAGYRDIAPEEIPELTLPNGTLIRVIAGKADCEGQVLEGVIQGGATEPLLMDVRLPAGASFSHTLPQEHNAFIYAYEGSLEIGASSARRTLAPQTAGVLSAGEIIMVEAGRDPASFLVLAARPIGEAVVQYGPFVMNTREEIEQAIDDYQQGKLT